MANDDKKYLPPESPERGIDGKAPENIPLGKPGHTAPAAGKQQLASSDTPTNVVPGEPKKVETNEDAPKGVQRYRVKDPGGGQGGVKIHGVWYQVGAEIELAAAEAQTVDGYLELVPSDKIA